VLILHVEPPSLLHKQPLTGHHHDVWEEHLVSLLQGSGGVPVVVRQQAGLEYRRLLWIGDKCFSLAACYSSASHSASA
jgi:hypothetical protein